MKNKIRHMVHLYMPDKLLNRIRGIKIFEYDRKQFILSASNISFEKLKFKLLLNTHVLEKGLSHINIRYGFGTPVLKKISNNISEWKEKDYHIETFEYKNCMAALKTYYVLHNEVDFDMTYFEEIFDKQIIEEILNYSDELYGGYKIIYPKEKKVGFFSDFALNRYSIREFSKEPVSIEEVKECVKVAQKSPSACNRQSSRVHIIRDKEKISKILDIQQGYRGYATPEILLVTTVDIRAYNNVDDRNLGYVDGGLFTMTLIYALEDKLIGACLLNTAFNANKDILIRKEIDMNPYEIFINFIPIGRMLDETIVANSTRVPVENIVEIH